MKDSDVSNAVRAIRAGVITPQHREQLLRALIGAHDPIPEEAMNVIRVMTSWRHLDHPDIESRSRASLRWAFEISQEYEHFMREVPAFTGFDPTWQVKVIPPYGGALARFLVTKGPRVCSIYLDAHQALGSFTDEDGRCLPYWEIHDCNDAHRFRIHDAAGLMAHVRRALEGPEPNLTDVALDEANDPTTQILACCGHKMGWCRCYPS